MDADSREKYGIPESHSFKQTGQRMKGTDEYFQYEQIDEDDTVVAKWEQQELMKISNLKTSSRWVRLPQ